ncbi:MAG: nicotinate-nucleotide--dimethylbenzimidazole phosphoribosyltransferase, partial [Jatrophihabitantaceae bacterium]
RPDELAALLGLPDGVVTLGWLCLGWPDELPPAPGLERAGWSRRLPLDEVVFSNRWPATEVAPPPRSRLRAPGPDDVVAARDEADVLLAAPSALGVLDGAINRVAALGLLDRTDGTLVLVAGRHQLGAERISAYPDEVTDEVLRAARAGRSAGAVAAAAAGLTVEVVDAGTSQGNLALTDPLSVEAVRDLIQRGEAHGSAAAARGLVALGEIGIGNTTVAATLAASLLQLRPSDAVGLGSSADSEMVERKQSVIERALARWAARQQDGDPVVDRLGCLGGPEFAYLTGVVLGAAAAGGVVVLDGLATSVAALLAVRREPAAAAHLVAGQRSRERAHPLVLGALGLEPLLDLRLRAGEGVGACLAAQLLASGLRIRRDTIRTAP